MNSTFTELWHFGGRVNVLCLELISSCALQKGCWQILCSQRKRAKMKHELKACSSYWCNIYGLEITAYLCGDVDVGVGSNFWKWNTWCNRNVTIQMNHPSVDFQNKKCIRDWTQHWMFVGSNHGGDFMDGCYGSVGTETCALMWHSSSRKTDAGNL